MPVRRRLMSQSLRFLKAIINGLYIWKVVKSACRIQVMRDQSFSQHLFPRLCKGINTKFQPQSPLERKASVAHGSESFNYATSFQKLRVSSRDVRNALHYLPHNG